MNKKQTIRHFIAAWVMLLGLAIGGIALAPSASADPGSTEVTCQDGKKKTANKTDKPDKSILDKKDYEYACRNNKGYAEPDATVTCKDSSLQNVYKNMADPKDKLTDADKTAACKSHGGIDTQKEEESEDPEDTDETTAAVANPVSGDGCGGVKTAIIKCDATNSGDLEDNGIWALLLMVLNILTAGVGVVAVAGIVYGAIMYTTAEDKADQVKKATSIITNVIIGLVMFALMWAGLNFIVPGGVFQ